MDCVNGNGTPDQARGGRRSRARSCQSNETSASHVRGRKGQMHQPTFWVEEEKGGTLGLAGGIMG